MEEEQIAIFRDSCVDVNDDNDDAEHPLKRRRVRNSCVDCGSLARGPRFITGIIAVADGRWQHSLSIYDERDAHQTLQSAFMD